MRGHVGSAGREQERKFKWDTLTYLSHHTGFVPEASVLTGCCVLYLVHLISMPPRHKPLATLVLISASFFFLSFFSASANSVQHHWRLKPIPVDIGNGDRAFVNLWNEDWCSSFQPSSGNWNDPRNIKLVLVVDFGV